MPRRHVRDLPLFWKVLLPFLALIVLVGSAGTFLIVHNLADRAQETLDQDLARRSFEARAVVHDRELYLVESVNFATGIRGMATAVAAHDRRAVEQLLGSVLVLKRDLNLLAVTDARGSGLVDLRQASAGTAPVSTSGTPWSGRPFVDDAMRDPSGARHAGIVREGDRTLLAIAAPLCSVALSCNTQGVAIAAIDTAQIAAEAAAKANVGSARRRGGVTMYGLDRRVLAAAGVPARAAAPLPAPRGLASRRTQRVHGADVATLYNPFDVQGETVGTLAVSIPASSAFSSVRGTAWRLVLIVVLVMIGVIAVGALLSRFILAQLRPLVVTNRALGRGDLAARVPVVSEDELGEVARGVNQMADQLQALYETLELRVAQRTAEVHRLLDERTEFFAAVSHDLRTPLAVIRSQAKMLLDPQFASRSPIETAETIVASSDQLLHLINELLEVAKAEAGRLDVDLEPVRLDDVVNDLRPTIDGLAGGAGLELGVTIEHDLPPVVADRRRLREVVLNLVDNAVKYTPSGGAVVVTAAAHNGHVEVAVSDTGMGIPEEDRARIFEPFYRVKGNRPQGGQASTGLGLALTKRLVEAQGGTITFESTPGEGTKFVFTLPRTEDGRGMGHTRSARKVRGDDRRARSAGGGDT